MENISIDEAFKKLTPEQKESFNKIVKKYNGLPNLPQILSEIENRENTGVEKQMYQSALLSSAIICKFKMEGREKEDGKEHSYRVAMLCGGIMEDPDFHFENSQVITAKSEKEAEEKYNKINSCNYYYGKVLAQLD